MGDAIRSDRGFTRRRRHGIGAAFLAAVLSTGLVAAIAAPAFAAFVETFSGADAAWPEGSTNGRFTVLFNGFGTVGVTSQRLRLSPLAATQPGETHSALVRAATDAAPVDLSVDVTTVAQLRTGSPANPWETGWVIWNELDLDHFWYLAVKTNGWELGRRDPAGPGGQVFVATGSTPATPVGQTRRVRIVHESNGRVKVWIDGALVADVRRAALFRGGAAMALYTEDATVDFDNLSVTTPG